jgi:penicillin-binding protein 1C
MTASLPDPSQQSGREDDSVASSPRPSWGGSGKGSILIILPSLFFLLSLIPIALDQAFPPNLDRLASVGTEVLDRNDRPLALIPARGGVWRFRTETEPPLLTNLLIAVEDRRFWYHPGIDPVALLRATMQLVRAGRVISGGSTLAMQAARLLEPRPRTLRSKLIEMARALQLELRFGHRGVLDIWMTLAPFGGNLEGVRAGSLAWFGVPPEVLEPTQAALLVAIPRRPERLRPDRHPAAASAVRDRVLAVGVHAHLFDASDEPVPTTRVALPRHAPQLLASLPHQPVVHTTLDLPLQTALERLGQQRLETLPDRASLAMLIADAKSREIFALYPGAWRDQERSGAIDLTQAVRSPGSALKPFIYAMAFADGVAAPDTVLPDLPRRFGAYAPENFDRGFAGSITAGEALQRSLNLPAVALLDRVGPLRFAATLHAAGFALRLPRGADPSLPLALGGDGVTLRQAAALYAALATDGTGGPLRLLADAPDWHPDFLPAPAAHQVADVLTRPLPDFGPRGIAWKTGTSWGGRDAWALGFDSRHVVAVWIGRPDGTPIPGATGTSSALPQLSRVFDLLPKAPRRVPPSTEQHPQPTPVATDALHLLFPPSGAVLSADGPVTIRVMGGRRPLTFLIDGAPLPTDHIRRDAAWLPSGPGFYRLTVLDADGAAVRATVQVRAMQ